MLWQFLKQFLNFGAAIVKKTKDSENFYHAIRLDFGLSLALALEFLLAADILATAVTPGWQSIGSLAAIAGIRTFLNYFLHQEVKEIKAEEYKRKSNIFLEDKYNNSSVN